jgi:hypothetical protein
LSSKVTPLQSNILQLAKSEHDANRLPEYLDLLDNSADTTELWPVILAADRLIGYLFTYGQQFISIGDRYFQPCPTDYHRYVSFDWLGYGCKAFCKNCSMKEWGCKAYPFGSSCNRFRIAWAIEHVLADTNNLINQELGG